MDMLSVNTHIFIHDTLIDGQTVLTYTLHENLGLLDKLGTRL